MEMPLRGKLAEWVRANHGTGWSAKSHCQAGDSLEKSSTDCEENELWSVSERQQAKLENMLQKPVETTAEKACQHETQKL